MEECFLSNKATLTKPNGGSFTPREIDVISCLINGATAKSISKLLGISHHTVGNHIGNIRSALNFCSQEQVIKFVESSNNYIQIRERYIDLLLFSKFQETLEKIKALKKTSQKYKCVAHIDVGGGKCILLDYLRLADIKVDISYDSTHYENDKFHIICCSESFKINLENLDADNIVVNEHHSNNVINLTGKCIKLDKSGTQYKAYFSLLNCISKIYNSKKVDDILNEFRQYYHNIKDERLSTNLERNQIEITDKRKAKYVMFVMLFFIALLIIPIATYWYSKTHKTTVLTNINMLVGEDIFLKRKDLISEMDNILKKQKEVKFLVLVGQGGIGKTTLARHYINKNASKIKWEINGTTEESTIKSFLALAVELSQKRHEKREELKYIQALEDLEMIKQSIISFVFSNLKSNGDWYILFDNVDDFKMIRAFIPSNKDLCGEGAVIITTRNANCGNMSFIPDKSVLNIDYLEEREKKELFCSVLYGKKYQSSEKVDKFLENIPPMPLDVSHAAYYIKNTNSSFKKYLEMIKSPSEELDKLHSKFLEEGAEHNKTRYKVTAAIFDKMMKINPDFKELLLFICLLDSKNIPKTYLDQFKNPVIVYDFIHNLKRFFSIILNNDTFSIHKSIQEIGLAYLNSLLTDNEKEVFLQKIVDIITPYSSIFWHKYKTYPRKLDKNELDELKMHIRSMIDNLKAFKLPISEKNKYITKLLLAVGFIYGEDNFYQEKHFLKEALTYNGNNKYIGNYEYAVTLLALGYAHLTLDELNDAKLWLNKGLEFCQNLRDAEILKACGLCDLGRYCAKTNEFNRAVTLLEKALSIIDNNKEGWAHDTSSKICFGLSHTYADHYINKPEGNKAVAYAQKSFKNFKLSDSIKDITKLEFGSEVVARWCLTKAYNRIGEHEKALKCALCYYYLYEKYFKNSDHVLNKALVDIEYGYALLRKGELISALDILNKAINTRKELGDNYYLFHALISRTEALIRLNKLDEAYRDFRYAVTQKGNGADNYTKLLFCTCLYHAFIIKYKQKDYKLALEHFADFSGSIKEFCKSFLSASEYNKLLDANAFEIITEESQIKTCLQNSIKIFSSIYGKDHPFVRDYIYKNANWQ